MSEELINLGMESLIRRDRVVVLARPDTIPLQRLIRRYEGEGQVIDLTGGRRARSAIITDAGFIILSSLRVRTIAKRFLKG